MTEKRFTLSDRHLTEIGNDYAILDGIVPCTQRYICTTLNNLSNENKKLIQKLIAKDKLLSQTLTANENLQKRVTELENKERKYD